VKAGWQNCRLGDLSALITKGTTPTSVGHQFVENGINFIKVESITGHHSLNPDKFAKIDASCHAHLKRSQIHDNDILFSIAGALGRCAIATHEVLPANTNQALAIVRLSNLHVSTPEYVLYALQSGIVTDQIERDRAGSAQQNLSLKQLSDFEIPLPPIEEQQRIVAVLDKAFAGIATATANAQKNLANARALFESFLGTAFGRDEVACTSYSLGEKSLITIIDGDRGTNYPNKSDFLETGHCLFLNTKNVRPDGFNFDTTMFVSEEKDANLRKGKLSRGDVIMTTRGTIGNLAVYDEAVAYRHIRINSGMLIFRPNLEKISSRYLFEILRSGIIKKQIAENISGAAQPQLPIHTLVKFTIPVPDALTDQDRIVRGLAEIEAAKNKLEQLYENKLSALSELKQSLLQRAFAGELT
jgi:type I restriction enzyme S subunit